MKKSEKKEITLEKNSWTVNATALDKINKVSINRPNSSEIVQKTQNDVNTLLNLAEEHFTQGNFIEAARTFRSLSRMTRNLEYEIEFKGKYSEKNQLNDLTGKEWLRHTKSWMIIDGKPSDLPYEIKDHPASFPPELAKHFIRFFTKKDGWIFDPFMGIGSTLAAAKELNRNCWGIELNSKYANYAKKRVANNVNNSHTYYIANEDSHNCKKIFLEQQFPLADLLLTSPPYWNILTESRGGVKSTLKQRVENGYDETYGTDTRDLGNIPHYNQYLDELTSIFLDFSEIIKDHGYIIVILQNIRPVDGKMRPLAWKFALELSRNPNIILKQEYIWLQDQKFLGIWGYPYSYVSNVHHHYCLVFQKE